MAVSLPTNVHCSTFSDTRFINHSQAQACASQNLVKVKLIDMFINYSTPSISPNKIVSKHMYNFLDRYMAKNRLCILGKYHYIVYHMRVTTWCEVYDIKLE